MKNQKLTDNDIIKALECWCERNCKEICPKTKPCENCVVTIIKQALNLINRQTAEIDALQDEVVIKTNMYNDMKDQRDKEHQYCMHYITMIAKAKSEAVKEFERKIKAHAYYIDTPKEHRVVDEDDIDAVLKEMMEQSVNYESSKTAEL